MAQPFIAQDTDHQVLEWIGGSHILVLLDAARSDGQLMVVRTTLHQGDASPVHVHSREDEVFLLLSGAGLVWVGDERHEVSQGGVAFLPRDIPHGYLITSPHADMLTLATPGGLEGFFRSAGHDLATPRPDGFAVTPATMAPALAQHGGRIIGPPHAEDDGVRAGVRIPGATEGVGR
jgi:quercetin dioxygenase-like cupin family protein